MATADDYAAISARLSEVQDLKVEEWVRLVRHSSTVPLAVERSLSWRLTRPVRLAQTAILVYRRDGSHRFWTTVRYRLRRMVTKR